MDQNRRVNRQKDGDHMTSFDRLSLQELTRPGGYDCACGRRHECALEYLNIGQGVLNRVPEMLSALGSARPFVLCDANTYDCHLRRTRLRGRCTRLRSRWRRWGRLRRTLPCHQFFNFIL